MLKIAYVVILGYCFEADSFTFDLIMFKIAYVVILVYCFRANHAADDQLSLIGCNNPHFYLPSSQSCHMLGMKTLILRNGFKFALLLIAVVSIFLRMSLEKCHLTRSCF